MQLTCEIQCQEVYCAYFYHVRLFPFHECARSKTQCLLTAVPSLKLFRLTQVYVWMEYQVFSFESACVEILSCKASNGSLERRKRDGVIPSHSHSDVCVFESMDHVPHDIPNNSHSTQLYIFEGNAAVIQMINKGRSPNLRHVSRTHRLDLDWSFERLNLDHSLLIKSGATRDFLDRNALHDGCGQQSHAG